MIENHIAVELYIYEDKDLYRSLFEHKEEIESDVGANLDWRELPEKKPAEFLSKKRSTLKKGSVEWAVWLDHGHFDQNEKRF